MLIPLLSLVNSVPGEVPLYSTSLLTHSLCIINETNKKRIILNQNFCLVPKPENNIERENLDFI
jgi:hypothetical protein